MKLAVVLRDEAQVEFDEAFNYYENQRAGLGVDFAERVQQVFDRISVNPRMHQVVMADIRKAVVTRQSSCDYRYFSQQPRSFHLAIPRVGLCVGAGKFG